ncbi:hypothetical protein L228DRAFT_249299 [Xylona heveae TC161]|uniref:Uncharacterized protein n=1 Tax=Xylona heveae (strain CBS 132557 / TC161) TaxID=1328760 RepID=A0A165AIJ7_XYLHT|nr:hypothetical protein L228DRAFT_249299 [Xylona heveae TC161]KZF20541.1 hypothetical protein L228DRAFT_249299 [Xylona heveae TC161]
MGAKDIDSSTTAGGFVSCSTHPSPGGSFNFPFPRSAVPFKDGRANRGSARTLPLGTLFSHVISWRVSSDADWLMHFDMLVRGLQTERGYMCVQ